MHPFAATLTMLLSFATLAAGQERAPRLVLEREFVLRGGACRCLAWSHDGNHIASGGEARDVQVIDAMTGEVVRELLDHGREVPNLVFAPDDARLLIGAPDQPAFALDCTTGRVVGDMGHAPRLVLPGWVQEAAAGAPAAVAPDGERWVCARNGQLEFHRRHELLRRVPLTHRAPIADGSVTADGKYVALAGPRGLVTVLRRADGEVVAMPIALRGTPIDHRDGPGLALLQEPPSPGGGWSRLAPPEGTEWRRGVVVLWSIDAMRAGEKGVVREWSVPGHPARDPFVESPRVPSPDGARSCSLDLVVEVCGPGLTTLGLFDRDDDLVRSFDLLGCGFDAAWSPASDAIAVLANRLHVCPATAAGDALEISDRCTAFAWLDARQLVFAELRGDTVTLLLRTIGAPGSTDRLVVPGPIVTDLRVVANGTRALLLRRNSAVLVRIDD
jgi:hypothetical protein